MSPVNTHLSFYEIRDFTAGFWNVGDWLMPPTAAQVMTDCYAIPGGGLRAWFKPTTISTAGIANVAQERVIGIFSRGGVGFRSGAPGDTSDRYLATYNATTNVTHIYRMDLTGGFSTWGVQKTFASVAAFPTPVTFVPYLVTASGVTHVVLSFFQTSTDDGIWAINYSDGVMTKLTSSLSKQPLFPVAVHQSRLVAGNIDGNIHFTGPGDETFGQNLVTTEPSRQLSTIMWLLSYSPGDLLVAKRAAPFFLVEDDLTNFTLRTMSDARNIHGVQAPAFGPMGAIYMDGADGIYETMDGSVHNCISQSISAATWTPNANADTGYGDVNFLKHWVVAPHGLVMDYDTKAWFKSSFMAANDCFHTCIDRAYDFILAATAGTNFSLYQYDTSESGDRAESYTWKSAPLRDPTSRQVEIREVQVFARTFNGATSSVSVTVNGDTRTLSVTDPSSRDMLAFLFKQRAETLDVTVTAASNQAGVEAPAIEVVRIGTHPGHQAV